MPSVVRPAPGLTVIGPDPVPRGFVGGVRDGQRWVAFQALDDLSDYRFVTTPKGMVTIAPKAARGAPRFPAGGLGVTLPLVRNPRGLPFNPERSTAEHLAAVTAVIIANRALDEIGKGRRKLSFKALGESDFDAFYEDPRGDKYVLTLREQLRKMGGAGVRGAPFFEAQRIYLERLLGSVGLTLTELRAEEGRSRRGTGDAGELWISVEREPVPTRVELPEEAATRIVRGMLEEALRPASFDAAMTRGLRITLDGADEAAMRIAAVRTVDWLNERLGRRGWSVAQFRVQTAGPNAAELVLAFDERPRSDSTPSRLKRAHPRVQAALRGAMAGSTDRKIDSAAAEKVIGLLEVDGFTNDEGEVLDAYLSAEKWRGSFTVDALTTLSGALTGATTPEARASLVDLFSYADSLSREGRLRTEDVDRLIGRARKGGLQPHEQEALASLESGLTDAKAISAADSMRLLAAADRGAPRNARGELQFGPPSEPTPTRTLAADRIAARVLDRLELDPASAGRTIVALRASDLGELGAHGSVGHSTGRSGYQMLKDIRSMVATRLAREGYELVSYQLSGVAPQEYHSSSYSFGAPPARVLSNTHGAIEVVAIRKGAPKPIGKDVAQLRNEATFRILSKLVEDDVSGAISKGQLEEPWLKSAYDGFRGNPRTIPLDRFLDHVRSRITREFERVASGRPFVPEAELAAIDPFLLKR